MTWREYLPAAERITAAVKAAWPNCEGVVAIGGGESGGSSSYKKGGFGTMERSHSVPSYISDLITANASGTAVDPGLKGLRDTTLSSLMNKQDGDIAGSNVLTAISKQSPTDYTGRSSLATVAGQTPYSGTFEANTEASYRQRAANAMAQAASGPDAVRGGTARTSIGQAQLAEQLSRERGHEVRAADSQVAGDVARASQTMAGIEGQRTGQSLSAATGLSALISDKNRQALEAGRDVTGQTLQNLGALQLAAELQGTTVGKQTDAYEGKGRTDQSQLSWNLLSGCCMTFLECLNGRLPWYVERGRKEFITPRRRAGYRWLSGLLVPVMQRWPVTKRLVNAVMVRPFLWYGAHRYGAEGASVLRGRLAVPVCKAWLAVWSTLGRFLGVK